MLTILKSFGTDLGSLSASTYIPEAIQCSKAPHIKQKDIAMTSLVASREFSAESVSVLGQEITLRPGWVSYAGNDQADRERLHSFP